MELDTHYTHIDVCPHTGERLNDDEIYYSDGVCPRCGDTRRGSIIHHDKIAGRWNRPSFWERITGKRHEFFRKEDEDAVMNALKGEHLDA